MHKGYSRSMPLPLQQQTHKRCRTDIWRWLDIAAVPTLHTTKHNVMVVLGHQMPQHTTQIKRYACHNSMCNPTQFPPETGTPKLYHSKVGGT